MNAQDVSRILEETALLLELKGENPFKARAYANASRTVRAFPEDINRVVADGGLQGVKGIGKTLAHDITELVTTGSMTVHEELKLCCPPSSQVFAKSPLHVQYRLRLPAVNQPLGLIVVLDPGNGFEIP